MNRYGALMAGALLALTGCLEDETSRLQMEAESEKPIVRTVGDVADIQTSGNVPVSGVGLVVNLDGTGGGAPPGEYRRMAEEYLKKNKIENFKEWLDSPNTALVLVNGEVPAGSTHGERIHVEITLPPGSKVKSLRGGYLLDTPLTSYASMNQVRRYVEDKTDVKPVNQGDGLLKGHVLANAQGPLQVKLKDKENASKDPDDPLENGVRRAWVWKGGKTKTDQPYYLVLNPDQQRYRMAIAVADRINETFHGPGALEKIATARNADTVVLTIPPQHRNNPAHFMRVMRMVVVDRPPDGGVYQNKLEEQLQQPETTLSAALRLEALGRDSIKPLTLAMRNSPYPLVCFAAAEALAYLGEPVCSNELAKLAEEHPSLQAYCLSALAALDDAASSNALEGLLDSETPEVRYGAFRALRELDPRASATHGRFLNKSFWLHELPGKSTPLVHLLSATRAEVALFGDQPSLVAPFSLRAGPDFILTCGPGEKTCAISRFSLNKKEPHVELRSLAIGEIIKTMAEMGALYDDVATMLLQARDTKCLNCALALDAVPKAAPIKTLADDAHVDKKLENEAELLKALSPDSPNLFDRP
jgi:flagellar basal body P-ring protein FlgI